MGKNSVVLEDVVVGSTRRINELLKGGLFDRR